MIKRYVGRITLANNERWARLRGPYCAAKMVLPNEVIYDGVEATGKNKN